MRLDLERYNRLLWAVNGTLLLAGMVVLLITGLTALWPSRDRGQSLPAGVPATAADAPSQPAILRLGLPVPAHPEKPHPPLRHP